MEQPCGCPQAKLLCAYNMVDPIPCLQQSSRKRPCLWKPLEGLVIIHRSSTRGQLCVTAGLCPSWELPGPPELRAPGSGKSSQIVEDKMLPFTPPFIC